MFEDLLKMLELEDYSVYAFEHFAQLCYKSVVERPEQAIFFLTLGTMAERFVYQYDESMQTFKIEDAQKKKILYWMEKMENSLSGRGEDQVKLLNKFCRDMMYS